MLEALINPKKAERHPWMMFAIGFLYAALSFFLGIVIFGSNYALAPYTGIAIILFCVAFSLPFMYYTIKLEERKNDTNSSERTILGEHGRAIMMLLWLFLGFTIAFSLAYMLPDSLVSNPAKYFKPQVETFCRMNNPHSYSDCVAMYTSEKSGVQITGTVTSTERLLSIFSNNIGVLALTIVLSALFGAGAIFLLAWNASVIAAAIGIFLDSDATQLHIGLTRFLIHGIPEIAAYFIAALSGGILGIGIIKHKIGGDKFWQIVSDVLTLIIIAIIILVISAVIEVFITPQIMTFISN